MMMMIILRSGLFFWSCRLKFAMNFNVSFFFLGHFLLSEIVYYYYYYYYYYVPTISLSLKMLLKITQIASLQIKGLFADIYY
jgi:hypothetical protein